MSTERVTYYFKPSMGGSFFKRLIQPSKINFITQGTSFSNSEDVGDQAKGRISKRR